MLLFFILLIIFLFTGYWLHLKYKNKSEKNNQLKEMLMTLSEEERVRFIEKNFQRYYREVQYDKHIDKVLKHLPDVGQEEFLLDYHREYFSNDNVPKQ